MRESALEAFKNAEEFAYANSSGGHELSRRAKNLLEESRDFIASYFVLHLVKLHLQVEGQKLITGL